MPPAMVNSTAYMPAHIIICGGIIIVFVDVVGAGVLDMNSTYPGVEAFQGL